MTTPLPPVWGSRTGDIAESKQDVGELNRQTLIGQVEQRGSAWHRRDDLQGAEDNHYPGFIPVEDVRRRLFDWSPMKVPVAFLVPCTLEESTFIDAAGNPVRVVQTQQSRVGVLRSDDDYDLGIFKSGSNHPPYELTLIRECERLTGTTLGISTAGCLQRGARAWVEFSLPETLHDSLSGFDYRPNLLKADSMDGTIPLTTALTVEATVCNNTLRWNLAETKKSGRRTKRRHTSGVISGAMDGEREALGILEMVHWEFLAGLHELIGTPVTRPQVIEVLDIIKPIPEKDGRGKTMAKDWRDQWMSVYTDDPMAAPWTGTAFGVLQTDNTFRHWYNSRNGNQRWEQNTWRAITGAMADDDREILDAVELVLAR